MLPPTVQPCPVRPAAVAPLVNVVKKFSTFALATRRLPPTSSGAAMRGFTRVKTGATVGMIRQLPGSLLLEVASP